MLSEHSIVEQRSLAGAHHGGWARRRGRPLWRDSKATMSSYGEVCPRRRDGPKRRCSMDLMTEEHSSMLDELNVSPEDSSMLLLLLAPSLGCRSILARSCACVQSRQSRKPRWRWPKRRRGGGINHRAVSSLSKTIALLVDAEVVAVVVIAC